MFSFGVLSLLVVVGFFLCFLWVLATSDFLSARGRYGGGFSSSSRFKTVHTRNKKAHRGQIGQSYIDLPQTHLSVLLLCCFFWCCQTMF